MSKRVELLIRDYPKLVMRRDCLRNQLQNFKGVTEQEMIDTMNYSAPQGDRVQTSGVSDKTSSIAIAYHEKADRINREWVRHLVIKLAEVEAELDFFHACLSSISPDLVPFMHDLVVERMTWDSLEAKYHISRFTVSKYRRRAIAELDALYADHDREVVSYILS